MNQSCPCGCNNKKMLLSEFITVAQSGTYFKDNLIPNSLTEKSGTNNKKNHNDNPPNDASFAKFIVTAQTGTYFTAYNNCD